MAILVNTGKRVELSFDVAWKDQVFKVWVHEFNEEWTLAFLDPISQTSSASPTVNVEFADPPVSPNCRNMVEDEELEGNETRVERDDGVEGEETFMGFSHARESMPMRNNKEQFPKWAVFVGPRNSDVEEDYQIFKEMNSPIYSGPTHLEGHQWSNFIPTRPKSKKKTTGPIDPIDSAHSFLTPGLNERPDTMNSMEAENPIGVKVENPLGSDSFNMEEIFRQEVEDLRAGEGRGKATTVDAISTEPV
ncbi:hypothetical protein Hanom_Chr16g01454421 [Helianthus anomalus]